MDDPASFFLWIPVLVVGIAALVATILAIAFKARPQPGLGPRYVAPATPGPDGVVAAMPAEGTWNAFLHRGSLGGTLGGTGGRFDVGGGHLRFTRDGAVAPQWWLPCNQIGVHAGRGFLSAPVLLYTPTGVLHCTVSREHINRLSQNTAKSAREVGYAKEFASVLIANGARHA